MKLSKHSEEEERRELSDYSSSSSSSSEEIKRRPTKKAKVSPRTNDENPVRTKTIKQLEDTIKQLGTSIKERINWLLENPKGATIKPKFSSTYTSRKKQTFQFQDNKSEERMLKADKIMQRKNVSPNTKKLIRDIKTKANVDIEESGLKIQSEHLSNLKNNSQHFGISKEDKKEYFEKMNEEIGKNVNRITIAMEREIDKLVMNDKLYVKIKKVKVTNMKIKLEAEEKMDEINREYTQRKEMFDREHQVSYEKEIKNFEEKIAPRLVKVGRDVELARKDLKESLEKSKTREWHIVEDELSFKRTMANADLIELNIKQDSLRIDHVNSLVKIYMQMPRKPNRVASITWNQLTINLERGFRSSNGDWDNMCLVLSDNWCSLGDIKKREEFERIVRVYAMMNPVSYNLNEDVEIVKLRNERDELLERIYILDKQISVKVNTLKKQYAYCDSEGLKITRRTKKKEELYVTYLTDPKPPELLPIVPKKKLLKYNEIDEIDLLLIARQEEENKKIEKYFDLMM